MGKTNERPRNAVDGAPLAENVGKAWGEISKILTAYKTSDPDIFLYIGKFDIVSSKTDRIRYAGFIRKHKGDVLEDCPISGTDETFYLDTARTLRKYSYQYGLDTVLISAKHLPK